MSDPSERARQIAARFRGEAPPAVSERARAIAARYAQPTPPAEEPPDEMPPLVAPRSRWVRHDPDAGRSLAERAALAVGDVAQSEPVRAAAGAVADFLPSGQHAAEAERQRLMMEQGQRPGLLDAARLNLLSAAKFAQGAVEFGPRMAIEAALPLGREVGAALGPEMVPGVPGTGEGRADILARQAGRVLGPAGIGEAAAKLVHDVVAQPLAPFLPTAATEALGVERPTAEETYLDPYGVIGPGALMLAAPAMRGARVAEAGARAGAQVAGRAVERRASPGEVAGEAAAEGVRGFGAEMTRRATVPEAPPRASLPPPPAIAPPPPAPRPLPPEKVPTRPLPAVERAPVMQTKSGEMLRYDPEVRGYVRDRRAPGPPPQPPLGAPPMPRRRTADVPPVEAPPAPIMDVPPPPPPAKLARPAALAKEPLPRAPTPPPAAVAKAPAQLTPAAQRYLDLMEQAWASGKRVARIDIKQLFKSEPALHRRILEQQSIDISKADIRSALKADPVLLELVSRVRPDALPGSKLPAPRLKLSPTEQAARERRAAQERRRREVDEKFAAEMAAKTSRADKPSGEAAAQPAPLTTRVKEALADESGAALPNLGIERIERAMDRTSSKWAGFADEVGRTIAEHTPEPLRAAMRHIAGQGNRGVETVRMVNEYRAARALAAHNVKMHVRSLRRAVPGTVIAAEPTLKGMRAGTARHSRVNEVLAKVFDVKAGMAPPASLSADAAAKMVMEEYRPFGDVMDALGRQLHEVAPEWLPKPRKDYIPYYYPATAIEALRLVMRGKSIREVFETLKRRLPDEGIANIGEALSPSETARGRTKARSKELTDEQRKEMGLITDPVYATARGVLELTELVEAHTLQSKLAASPHTVATVDVGGKQRPIRDVIREVGEYEGRMKESAADAARVGELDAERAQMQDALDVAARDAEKRGMVQLPYGGKDGKWYGPLEGAYVDRHTALDIHEVVKGPRTYEHLDLARRTLLRVWRGHMKAFKIAHTALRPVTGLANFMTNVMQHDVEGFPVLRQGQLVPAVIADMTRARRGGAKNVRDFDRWEREAIENGATIGTHLAPSELSVLADVFEHGVISGAPTGTARALLSAVRLASTLPKAVRSAQRLYAGIDHVFKVAHYRYAREILKLPVEEAVKRAQNAGGNYAAHPQWNRWIGENTHPFTGWLWHFAAWNARNMARHPVRYLKWASLPLTLNAVGHAMSEDGDIAWGFSSEARDKRAQERAGMGRAQRALTVRLPARGAPRRATVGLGSRTLDQATQQAFEPQEFDAWRVLPFLNVWGRSDSMLPSTPAEALVFTQPLGIFMHEVFTANRTGFTDKPVVGAGRSRAEAALDVLKHYVGTFGPGILKDFELAWRANENYAVYDMPRSVLQAMGQRYTMTRPVTRFQGEAGRLSKLSREEFELDREVNSEFTAMRFRWPNMPPEDRAAWEKKVLDRYKRIMRKHMEQIPSARRNLPASSP